MIMNPKSSPNRGNPGIPGIPGLIVDPWSSISKGPVTKPSDCPGQSGVRAAGVEELLTIRATTL